MEKAVIKSLLILISLSSIFSYAFPPVLSQEIIYRNSDWIRYEYVIKTPNETCVWIIKVTIDWVNGTHVKYSAGLERLVSGGDFCQSYTALLILGLSFESANPLEFNITTPSSRRILINPTYTGTFDYEKFVVTYYKGILLKYSENATTPFVGVIEVNANDTSIEELKAKITATTTPTESYPATQ